MTGKGPRDAYAHIPMAHPPPPPGTRPQAGLETLRAPLKGVPRPTSLYLRMCVQASSYYTQHLSGAAPVALVKNIAAAKDSKLS